MIGAKMNVNDLIAEKRDDIIHIVTEHGAHNIRIFGSVARGEADTESDLDLLVEIEKGRSLLDHIALSQDLEDLLGCKVDVISEKALHWYIRDRILKEAIPI